MCTFHEKKRAESAVASQLDLALAAQEETCRAIVNVLELRQSYLESKGIKDLRYVLTGDQRVELIKRAKAEYEDSEEQRILQYAGVKKWNAKRKLWGRKEVKSLPAFLRTEKKKRWHQHLQQVCGTRQIWKVLAFTGCFDPDSLREELRLSGRDRDVEEEP